jgi:hypothetical protein
MIAMAPPRGDWICLADAVEIAGCTQSYLRRLLRDGRLAGWKAAPRNWLVQRSDVVALASTLTTRSASKRADDQPKQRKKRAGRG